VATQLQIPIWFEYPQGMLPVVNAGLIKKRSQRLIPIQTARPHAGAHGCI